MSITIKDIANLAGVSHVTVLRVLNGNPNVKQKTKDKVLAIAKEYNYVPNRLARNLSGKQSNFIGLIITDIANPLFAELVRGADDVFSSSNYQSIIYNSDNKKELASKGLITMKELRVAGLLVALPALEEAAFLQELEQLDLPYVSLSLTQSPAAEFVAFDDRKGGYLLGKHLAEGGHQQIVCLTPEGVSSRPTKLRLEGVKAAFQEHGITLHDEHIMEAGFGYEDGYRMADRIVQIGGVTATICLYDNIAIGLLRRLKELGIAVPQQMAVAGFDDNKANGYLETKLTSVALPKYALGETAARLLLDKLEQADDQPAPIQQLIIEPVLMVRESTQL